MHLECAETAASELRRLQSVHCARIIGSLGGKHTDANRLVRRVRGCDGAVQGVHDLLQVGLVPMAAMWRWRWQAVREEW